MDTSEITAGTHPTVAAEALYREAMNIRHEGITIEDEQDTEDLILLALGSALVGIAMDMRILAQAAERG